MKEDITLDLSLKIERIAELREEAQMKLDAMPEAMRFTKEGEKLQRIIDHYDTVETTLQFAIDTLDKIEELKE